jgi:hypothetical protein
VIVDTAFVSAIPGGPTDDDLARHFADYRPVQTLIIPPGAPGRPGCGFAKVATETERDRAIAAQAVPPADQQAEIASFGNRILCVKWMMASGTPQNIVTRYHEAIVCIVRQSVQGISKPKGYEYFDGSPAASMV